MVQYVLVPGVSRENIVKNRLTTVPLTPAFVVIVLMNLDHTDAYVLQDGQAQIVKCHQKLGQLAAVIPV
jgi:hypothetical protein